MVPCATKCQAPVDTEHASAGFRYLPGSPRASGCKTHNASIICAAPNENDRSFSKKKNDRPRNNETAENKWLTDNI